jgi:hypothetical protein
VRDRRAAPVGGPPAPPTPVAADELVAAANRLRPLLAELAELTGTGHAWGLRVLRRNVEIALLSPETLESAENQLDFIEELAEAVWDGGDPGFRLAIPAGPGPQETRTREERRQAIVAQLDELADHLCRRAESWQDLLARPGGEHRPVGMDVPGNPQPGHRF